MELNVTTDYAIRTVLYLAIKNELATANEIATAMGIPPSYVLKITRKLVVAGIIKRIVGAKGGFLLAKKQTEIINVLEATTKLNRCLEADKYCSRFATENCPVRAFYCELQGLIEKKLKATTIASLLQG
ncbi:RrF2 family transcriptional regulator [Phascolarctobacterium faecium]|uniref:RrF2 family transcriptional regulator n=1 Tax=Phascolarctobacterium faecium TaxID=33025 RepID=UPI0039968180